MARVMARIPLRHMARVIHGTRPSTSWHASWHAPLYVMARVVARVVARAPLLSTVLLWATVGVQCSAVRISVLIRATVRPRSGHCGSS